MSDKLTVGGISALLSQGDGGDGCDLVLQVLDIKAMPEKKRARLTLSDGAQFSSAVMVASQMYATVAEGVEPHALLRVTQATVSDASGKKFAIVLALSVLEAGAAVGGKVGDPSEFGASTPRKAPAGSASTPATQAPGSARGPISVRHDACRSTPIGSLNPYMNRWTLKARVAVKNDKVSWSNARGDGTLFKVTLLDGEGDEVEAVFFKEACEKFYDAIDENAVYYFSGGKVKPCNKRFSSTKCDYEITFDASATIELAADASGVGGTKYDFVKIADLGKADEGALVDVLAIVKAADDVSEVISQKLGGKALTKRDVTLVDESGVDVRLTLWGDRAKSTDVDLGSAPLIAFKGLKVSEYNGTKSLGYMRSTRMACAPGGEQADALAAWWKSGGDAAASTSLSRVSGGGSGLKGGTFAERRDLGDLKADPGFGQGDKPSYATFKATLMKVREERLWYEACAKCQKKVTQTSDGSYACEKCNASTEDCDRRYIVSAVFADAAASSWVSAFNDAGLVLFDDTAANDLAALAEESGDALPAFLRSKAYFRDFLVRVRAKSETWNDNTRVKTSIVNIAKLDFAAESRELIAALSA